MMKQKSGTSKMSGSNGKIRTPSAAALDKGTKKPGKR